MTGGTLFLFDATSVAGTRVVFAAVPTFGRSWRLGARRGHVDRERLTRSGPPPNYSMAIFQWCERRHNLEGASRGQLRGIKAMFGRSYDAN